MSTRENIRLIARASWSAHEMMVLTTSACGERSDEPLRQGFRFSYINKVCTLKKTQKNF